MSMLKFSRLPFLMMITLLSVTTFVGCGDDEPEGPDGTDVTVPKKGSTYTYTEYDLDDQGNKDESTEQGVVAKVEETDVSIGGKTGALKFTELYDDGDTDTTYIVYESNGDMSILLGIPEAEDIDPIWVTVPFGSHTAKTYPLNDSIDDGSGTMVPVSLTIKTKYLRTESVTIQSETMEAWICEIAITGSIPTPFGTVNIDATSEVQFVPEIGYIYRTEENSSGFGFDSTTIRLLVSYMLAS